VSNPLFSRGWRKFHAKVRQLIWEMRDYYSYNWVDPVSKETMPTIGWEARREGVDDYR